MTREVFLKVTTRALRQTAGRSPEEQAAAVAAKLDEIAELLGDAPAPAEVMPERPAFPAPNPEAFQAVTEPPSNITGIGLDPYAPTATQPLIVPATSIPDKVERVVEPKAKARAPKAEPAERVTVQDLNLMVQQSTPPLVTLKIPLEDGTARPVDFVRDVISQNAFESVRVMLYPRGANGAARESTEVHLDISVDDVPVDFRALMQKLFQLAVDSVRPRGAPREVPVRPFAGPVKHAADDFVEQVAPGQVSLNTQTMASFKSMG